MGRNKKRMTLMRSNSNIKDGTNKALHTKIQLPKIHKKIRSAFRDECNLRKSKQYPQTNVP